MSAREPKGFVIYRGPSMLDGAPIVAVALLASGNRKTGNMVQTYILRDGIAPVQAAREGADASVCGDCPHRPVNAGSCYVVLGQGPTVVHKQIQAGAYPSAAPSYVGGLVSGRMVRLGTYGDPAAVPAAVWWALVADSAGWTGYTHQWRKAQAQELRGLCMASCDSPEDRAEAQRMGWRTFRVRTAQEELDVGKFLCPASDEAGKRKTCAQCGACAGASPERARQASPAILAHGAKARRFIALRAV